MSFFTPLLTAFSSIGGATAGGGLSAGSLLSAGAGILGGISAYGQASYQASLASANAKIAEENAQLASDQAQTEQLDQDRQTAALLGEQEAIQGASGLSLSGGSQLRTRRTANILGRQDAMNIREQGARSVQNYRQQAENFRAEASSARAQGLGSLAGGFLNAGSSLIGGARSVRSPNRITSGSYDPWAGLRRA